LVQVARQIITGALATQVGIHSLLPLSLTVAVVAAQMKVICQLPRVAQTLVLKAEVVSTTLH
jgi:hypothetical protein